MKSSEKEEAKVSRRIEYPRFAVLAAIIALLAVASAWPEQVRAQSKEKASEFNSKAIEAYKAKKYLEAIDYWQQAYDYATDEQKTKLHKNIGLALQQLERLPEAWYHMHEYLRRDKWKDKKVGKRLSEVEKNLVRTYLKVSLNSRPVGATAVLPPGDRLHQLPTPLVWWLPPGEYAVELKLKGYKTRKETVKVALRGANNFTFELKLVAEAGKLALKGGVEGSKVLVDGKVAGDLPFSKDLPPGEYSVEVIYPDGTSWKKVLTVNSKKTASLTVPAPRAAGDPVGPVQKPGGGGGGRSHTLEWVAIGAGGALLVAGGVLMAMYSGKVDDMSSLRDDEYPELSDSTAHKYYDSYREDYDALWDEAQPLGVMSIVCFVAGGASVLAGAGTMLLLDDPPTASSGVSLTPLVMPGTTGFSLDYTF